ncbi:MAG: hypothetical protein RhofKO_16280 [Rhodothermales bacterium]
MKLYARLFAIAWTLGILAACSIPGTSLPSVSLWEFDKVAHFILFCGFGMLWMWAAPQRFSLILLLGVAYAIGTEFYQGLLPWPRTPDPYDALANTIGLLAGVGSVWWRHRRSSMREGDVT